LQCFSVGVEIRPHKWWVLPKYLVSSQLFAYPGVSVAPSQRHAAAP
jgi:hypothetical protein